MNMLLFTMIIQVLLMGLMQAVVTALQVTIQVFIPAVATLLMPHRILPPYRAYRERPLSVLIYFCIAPFTLIMDKCIFCCNMQVPLLAVLLCWFQLADRTRYTAETANRDGANIQYNETCIILPSNSTWSMFEAPILSCTTPLSSSYWTYLSKSMLTSPYLIFRIPYDTFTVLQGICVVSGTVMQYIGMVCSTTGNILAFAR